MLGGVLAGLAIANFPRRVDAVQKQLPVLLDHAADPQALHDVCADSDDFHAWFSSR